MKKLTTTAHYDMDVGAWLVSHRRSKNKSYENFSFHQGGSSISHATIIHLTNKTRPIVTAQPQPQPKSTLTRVGVDKVISWTTTTPPTPPT